ncbi:MAG: class I SAM-dependent methyltransferase [Deltaproteobacteria bacterium]|nr:class I SAM-dependent methyltransferase [Deltaproteobacteria bacterium]MDQ3299095.1 class I SAM-dependent methyltransferase [Myxococcota bacterium]
MRRARLFLLAVAACGGSTPSRPAPVHAEPLAGDHRHDPAHGHHQAGAHDPAHGGHHGGGMHHRFENAEAWAKVFDDPSRDAWQQPDRVIAALALAPTMTVADIGAGTGYFTVRIARAVPQGTVIATDLEPDMVRYLGERAGREGLTNVRAVATPPDDPQLAPASVDRVLVVDVWHHLGDRAVYARKLAAALAPGGLVAVVDFKLDAKLGPPRQHRLAPDAIIADLAAAGLTASVALDLPEQYVVIGRRAAR